MRGSDSPDGTTTQGERDESSDSRAGNRERVSKPIEITDRGILVCHQRRRKIVMRKIGKGVWSLNVEPLNFELP